MTRGESFLTKQQKEQMCCQSVLQHTQEIAPTQASLGFRQLKIKGRDKLPGHTMQQIAATRRRDRLLQQIASCDM